MPYSVIADIASLEDYSVDDLCQRWESVFKKPPNTRRRAYLIPRLAYEIQRVAYGGMTEESQETLDGMIDGRIEIEKKNNRIHTPPVGTKLIRQYGKEEHHVMVTRSGFEYKGATHKSLSEIARIITGTRWSGPVFFGLKEKKRKKKSSEKD